MSAPSTPVIDAFSYGAVAGGLSGNGNWLTPIQGAGSSGIRYHDHGTQTINPSASLSSAYLSTPNYGPDCELYITVNAIDSSITTHYIELYLRVQNPTSTTTRSSYQLRVDSAGNWLIRKTINNSSSTLATLASAPTIAAGSKIAFQAIGDTLTAWHQASGGSWVQVGSTTDTDLHGLSGLFGLAIQGSTGDQLYDLDDLGGGTLSGAIVKSGYAAAGGFGAGRRNDVYTKTGYGQAGGAGYGFRPGAADLGAYYGVGIYGGAIYGAGLTSLYVKTGYGQAAGAAAGTRGGSRVKTGYGKAAGVGTGFSSRPGVLARPVYMLEAEFTYGVWTDLTDRLRSLSIERGRQQELDRVEAGIMRLTLTNRDRALDPTNTDSFLYPNVRPMVPIRFRVQYLSDTFGVYYGFVERWPPLRRGPRDAEVQIEAVDLLAALEAGDVAGFFGSTRPGLRLAQILQTLGWTATAGAAGWVLDDANLSLLDQTTMLTDLGATVQLDPGISQLADADFTANTVSALQHIQDVADSELGVAFVDGDGVFNFHDRHHRLGIQYLAPQGVFGDQPENGTEFPYTNLEPSFDLDHTYNGASLTVPGDDLPATAIDAASRQLPPSGFGPRDLSKDTILADWDDAQSQAQWLVYLHKQPVLRFDQLLLKGSDFTVRGVPMWQQIFGRDLGDRITVIHRPPPVKNIVLNGSFEQDDLTPWYGYVNPGLTLNDFSRSYDWSEVGGASAHFKATNTDATARWGQIVTPYWLPGGAFPVTPGGVYTGSAYVKLIGPVPDQGFSLIIQWFQADSSTPSAITSQTPSAWVTVDNFEGRLVSGGVAPADAAYCIPILTIGTAVAGRSLEFYADGIQIEGGPVATDYTEYAGPPIRQDCHIEGISHQLTPGDGGKWTTSWQLSPALGAPGWVLGDSTFGDLEQTTVLVY